VHFQFNYYSLSNYQHFKKVSLFGRLGGAFASLVEGWNFFCRRKSVFPLRLFVCSFVRLFICSFVRLFICLFVSLFVCSLFVRRLFVVCSSFVRRLFVVCSSFVLPLFVCSFFHLLVCSFFSLFFCSFVRRLFDVCSLFVCSFVRSFEKKLVYPLKKYLLKYQRQQIRITMIKSSNRFKCYLLRSFIPYLPWYAKC